jgi:hypothetical protein
MLAQRLTVMFVVVREVRTGQTPFLGCSKIREVSWRLGYIVHCTEA